MKFLKGFFFVLLIIALLFLYKMVSTGYFRSIENHFEGTILKNVEVPGAEDIMVNREYQFALISSTARQSLRSGKAESGGLYFMDLKDGGFNARLISGSFSQPFFPHGISMFPLDSAHFRVYAINHVNHQHTIEVFHLYGDSLVHEKTMKDESMISPNDIVAIDDERFYFTNDHNTNTSWGKLIEDYLGLARTTVIYYDGHQYKEVAGGIAYANGINYDATRQLMFVASPSAFLIKVYQRGQEGDLTFIEDIDCHTGVDNIEFDEEGKLWVGCHPNLLGFTSYAAKKKDFSPSEVIQIDYRGKGDYSVETVYLNDGSAMSASTVAAVYKDYLLVGNVMDDHFLVLQRAKK